VRELENLIEQLVVTCEGKQIKPSDLPIYIYDHEPETARKREGKDSSCGQPLDSLQIGSPKTLKDLERNAIIAALAKNGWIQARAARELGLTQRQIGYKIKKYQIKFPWEAEAK